MDSRREKINKIKKRIEKFEDKMNNNTLSEIQKKRYKANYEFYVNVLLECEIPFMEFRKEDKYEEFQRICRKR